MASKSKSIKTKKQRDAYRQLPAAQTLSSRAEMAKTKLRNTPEHATLRPSELDRLATDYTDKDRLKELFEIPQDGGVGDKVSVKLFLARPEQEDRERTFTGSVASDDSVELHFEQFCSYGINSEAAILVGDRYLKWTRDSLVIPRGMKIRDDSHGAQPLSLGDEPPGDLGETNKLDQLLELVTEYNGTYHYHAVSRNSKVFVRQALQRLGKDIHPLLHMFDGYQEKIKGLQTLRIRDGFRSHRELDEFYKQTDHATIVKNKRNVEYLFFLCVCFHVQMGKATDRSSTEWVCAERDCCLPFLVSNLTQENLIFNDYWRIFTQ